MEQFKAILKKYWRYDSFRENQLEIIEKVCSGKDVLALMPTGGGKSLLYQIPGLYKEGICIVVTPLIALMKDQTDRLRRMGIKAHAIHSGLSSRQCDLILDDCAWGDAKFLYVSPERLKTDTFRLRLGTFTVSLIAVDEAHCISQWGHDFRPSYLDIADIREISGEAPLIALTASATPEVVNDIAVNLKMDKPLVFRNSFVRPNLSYAVRFNEDKDSQLIRIINSVKGSGIVYARTREACEKISEKLKSEGIEAEFYHAGLPSSIRNERQDKWLKGQIRVIVSTNAFGMGIDKSDVRFVIHYDSPDSLEAYYQEAGRAGRDGKRSYAVLLKSADDDIKSLRRIKNEYPPLERIKDCYDNLFNYLGISIGGGKFASFAFNIYDFANKFKMFLPEAVNSIKLLEQNNYLSLSDETDNPPRIRFCVGRDDLYKLRIEKEELDHIIRCILRLYTGLFSGNFVNINVQEIAAFSGYTVETVGEYLKTLWQQRIINYIPANRSPILFLSEERLPTQDVYISPDSHTRRKDSYLKRFAAITGYSENSDICRSVYLDKYFGNAEGEECAYCDVCLSKKSASHQPSLEEMILKNLSKPLTIKDLVGSIKGNPENIISTLKSMLAENKISQTDGGKIKINR